MAMLIVVSLLISASLAVAEECPAAPGWFSAGGAPVPSNSEPSRGNDCEFYQRAWQTFLYVTDNIDGTPRLLSYKTYSEVFGTDPKVGSLGAVANAKGRMLELAPRLMKAAQTTDAEDVLQAGSNAILLDTSGRPIFYNIFMNPTFVDFVQTKGYNQLAKLQAAPATEELPVGAVEFKAAWQIVDDANPPKDRIVVQAQVPWLIAADHGKLKVDKSRPSRTVTVSLIGLHVVIRTEGHPEMIWATFEYDRNAPSAKGNPTTPNAGCVNQFEPKDDAIANDASPYLLFSSDGAVNQKPQSLLVKDDPKQIFEAQPKTAIARSFPFSACSPGRAQPLAITEIDGAIVAVNESAKSQLADPARKSYSLIGAVWLDEPRNPNDKYGFKEDRSFEDFELGGENRLSSASMESFTQIGSPNCFTCHDTSSKGNLDPKRLSVSHIFRRFSLGH
ncbi:hypothetical protein XH80_09190 [Bradyrhizobium sp. CCBAU 45384]|nr:hypothetical protein [Bradyrhizobium sp. CCBAU 45384]